MPDRPDLPITEEPLKLICREAESGLLGELTIQDNDLLLKLFSFDQEIRLPEAKSRTLLLETGGYATLLECFEAGSSGSWQGSFKANRQDIRPHFVLLGRRPWTAADKVGSLHFTFVGARQAIHYGEHQQSRIEAETGMAPSAHNLITHVTDLERLDILELEEMHGIRVKLRMFVAGSFGGSDPQVTSTPFIVVEFKNGASIPEAWELLYHIKVFFELSLGHRTRPLEISIAPHTDGQPPVGEESRLTGFRVRTWFDDWTAPERLAHSGNVIFFTYSPDGRETTKLALKAWLDRRSKWRTAYDLASQYLAGPEVYGRNRLVRLMAWFEAIPPFQGSSGVLGKDLQGLRRAIRGLQEFASLNVSPERLSQVLAELKRRPLEDRLTSTIEQARARFGDEVVPIKVESACRAAIKLRHVAAHGADDPLTSDIDTLVNATTALELVCLLSMLGDLGIDIERLRRINFHPLLAYLVKLKSHEGSSSNLPAV